MGVDVAKVHPVISGTGRLAGHHFQQRSQVAALHRHRRGGEVDPAPRRDPALPPHLDPGGRAGLAPRGRHQQQPQPEGGLPLAGDREESVRLPYGAAVSHRLIANRNRPGSCRQSWLWFTRRTTAAKCPFTRSSNTPVGWGSGEPMPNPQLNRKPTCFAGRSGTGALSSARGSPPRGSFHSANTGVSMFPATRSVPASAPPASVTRARPSTSRQPYCRKK